MLSFCFYSLENMDRLLRLGGGMPGLGQVSVYHVSIVILASICVPRAIKDFKYCHFGVQ